MIDDVRRLHAKISRSQRELLVQLAALEAREAWLEDGARDMPHWVSMQLDISYWKASRWIAAGKMLADLPAISSAFERGDLSLDKAVELTRLATPEREAGLVTWAERVSAGAIRRRADLERRIERCEVEEAEESRSVTWWYFDEGRRFALGAELPAASGAMIARALDRVASELPAMPDVEPATDVHQRRADALAQLRSGRSGAGDGDRTTVVLHARLEADGSVANAQIEATDGIVPKETVERAMCTARLQLVREDAAGDAIEFGRASRVPSASMVRQVRYRDQECRFPGCGTRRFTEAHHIVWWTKGGRTDLDNLLLICSFHHKLVHEYGWSVARVPTVTRAGCGRTARGIEPDRRSGGSRPSERASSLALPTGTLLAILLALRACEC